MKIFPTEEQKEELMEACQRLQKAIADEISPVCLKLLDKLKVLVPHEEIEAKED